MAQGRSTKTISMIKWIQTSKLSKTNSISPSFIVSLNPHSSSLTLTSRPSPSTSHPLSFTQHPPTLAPSPLPLHRPSWPRNPYLSPLTASLLELNPHSSLHTLHLTPLTSRTPRTSAPSPLTPASLIPHPALLKPHPTLFADSHQATRISLSQPPPLEPHASPLSSFRSMAGWEFAPASVARQSRSVQAPSFDDIVM